MNNSTELEFLIDANSYVSLIEHCAEEINDVVRYNTNDDETRNRVASALLLRLRQSLNHPISSYLNEHPMRFDARCTTTENPPEIIDKNSLCVRVTFFFADRAEYYFILYHGKPVFHNEESDTRWFGVGVRTIGITKVHYPKCYHCKEPGLQLIEVRDPSLQIVERVHRCDSCESLFKLSNDLVQNYGVVFPIEGI